jgi:Rrf2 family transcriptional regulator, cysteine metabolism repressor
MKISYKCDYALKAIFELSLRYIEEGGRIVSIQELAKSGDMPTKFLEQILLILRKGGFVKSKRGVNGGFILARSPIEITIGEVIKFIEGPIGPISCVEEECYQGCKDIKNCIFRDVWKDVRHSISVIIDTTNFEELVQKYRKKKVAAEPLNEYII